MTTTFFPRALNSVEKSPTSCLGDLLFNESKTQIVVLALEDRGMMEVLFGYRKKKKWSSHSGLFRTNNTTQWLLLEWIGQMIHLVSQLFPFFTHLEMFDNITTPAEKSLLLLLMGVEGLPQKKEGLKKTHCTPFIIFGWKWLSTTSTISLISSGRESQASLFC